MPRSPLACCPFPIIRISLLLSLFSLLVSRAGAAQDSTSPPHGFIASRYDTHTSSNIFVGYSLGRVTPMVALVHNPRSQYSEAILGLVRLNAVNRRHFSLTYAVAGAHVDDVRSSWYGQLYVLPTFSAGRFEASGTAEWYVPLDNIGVGQWALNPGNVFIHVSPRFKVGGVTVLSTQTNAPYNLGAGPSAQLKIPQGYFQFDWVIGVTRWVSESRVSFFTAY